MTIPAEPKDIVDKLRNSLGWSKSRDHLCEAAANEIERLRAQIATLRPRVEKEEAELDAYMDANPELQEPHD